MKAKYILFLIIIVAIGACKKNTPTAPPVEQSNVDIYAAGYSTYPGIYSPVATYWKNGKATILLKGISQATGIALKGNDVYISGYYTAKNDRLVACYWKNGIMKKLTDSVSGGRTTGIVIQGNDVYITGSAGPWGSVYWKNDAAIPLINNNATASGANAIAIQNSDIYIAGTVYSSTNIATAVYWKNGVIINLSGTLSNTLASSIAVNNNDVYVVGSTSDNIANFSNISNTPMYWKNGTVVMLAGDLHAIPNVIALKGNNIYIGAIGNGILPYFFRALYWKNGTVKELELTSVSINGIATQGNDVYFAGQNSNLEAVYWKNDIPVSVGEKGSNLLSITVVPK